MPMNAMGFQNGIAFDRWGSVIKGNITYDRHNPPWPDSDDGTRYDVWYEDRTSGRAERTPQYRNLPSYKAIGICNEIQADDCRRGMLMVDVWIELANG